MDTTDTRDLDRDSQKLANNNLRTSTSHNNDANPNHGGSEDPKHESDFYPIIPMSMVEVLPRTWPGINKPGGVARVMKCYYERETETETEIESNTNTNTNTNNNDNSNTQDYKTPTHIDVRYVVGTKRVERKVTMEYCKPAPQYSYVVTGAGNGNNGYGNGNGANNRAPSLRNRSKLLGRCTHCGSLRSDCDSCDWKREKMAFMARSLQQEQGRGLGHGHDDNRKNTNVKTLSRSRRRRAREESNLNDDSPSTHRKQGEIDDEGSGGSIIYSNSDNYHDDDDDDDEEESSSDESFQFYRRKSKSRSTRIDARTRAFLSSSSESSDGDGDHMSFGRSSSSSSSSSDDDDDEILSKLRSIPHARLKDAKKRARRMARRSRSQNQSHNYSSKLYPGIQMSMNSSSSKARTKDIEKAKKRKLRRLRTAQKYEESGQSYKARMRFLNSQLAQITRTNQTSKANEIRRKMKALDRTGSKDMAVARKSTSKLTSTSTSNSQSVLEGLGLAESDEGHSNRSKESPEVSTANKGGQVDRGDDEMSESSNSTPLANRANSKRNRKRNKDDVSKSRFNASQSSNNNTKGQVVQDAHPIDFVEEHKEEREVGFVDGTDIGEREIDENCDEEVAASDDMNETEAENRQLNNQQILMNQAKNSDISGYYEDDPMLNTFIQPEGEDVADNLPADLVDRSANIPFEALPDFYAELETELTTEKLPSSETILASLEAELETARSDSCSSFEKTTLLLSFERRCRQEYDKMKLDLIRNGTDQCRCALKRFGTKKVFRKEKRQLSLRDWRSKVESIDLRFDDLDKQVESVLRQVWKLLVESSNINGFDTCENDDIGCTTGSNSEPEHTDSPGDYSSHMDHFDVDDTLTSNNMEAHPYASTVKKRNQTTSRENWEKGYIRNTDKNMKRGRKRISTSDISSRKQHNHGGGKHQSRLRSDDTLNRHSTIPQRIRRSGKKSRTFAERRTIARRADGISGKSDVRNCKRGVHVLVNSNDDKDSGNSRIGKRARGQARASDPSSGSTTGSQNMNESLDGIELTVKGFYEGLNASIMVQNRNTSTEDPPRVRHFHSVASISQTCERLSTSYTSPESESFLEQLPFMMENSGCNDEKVLAFRTLFDLLTKNGRNSLQELIVTNSADLLTHINLLRCAIKLLGSNMHSCLKPENGIVYKIFSRKRFINVVMLQIIDVMYSQLLSNEWGSPKKLSAQVYDGICGLCEELGKITHTIEDFSKIILTFPCQKWYMTKRPGVGESKNIWYVTSLAPKSIDLFWQGEEVNFADRTSARLCQFKSKLVPRKEIDALWGIIAWFAKANLVKSILYLRWRFIVTLLTFETGSLGKIDTGLATNHNILPPSTEQLKCCEEELFRVNMLVASGAMDPLPSEDVLLIKIMQKSVTLLSHRDRRNIGLCMSRFSKPPHRKDTKTVFGAWEDSDLENIVEDKTSNQDFQSTRLLQDLLELKYPDEWRHSSLLPSSKLLINILLILQKWTIHLPNKIARWTRFGDKLSLMVNRMLVDAEKMIFEAITSSQNDIGDAFAESFSVDNTIATDLSLKSWRAVSLCEAVVYIVIIVLHGRMRSRLENETSFPLQVNLQFCEKVWRIVSDDGMKMYQAHLDQEGSILNEGSRPRSPRISIYMSLKLFSSLLLLVLDLIKNQKGDECIQFGDDCVSFVISCLLSSMLSACACINNAKGQFVAPTSLSSPLYGEDGTTAFNILHCGLYWFSCALNEMNYLLRRQQSLHNDQIKCLEKSMDRCIPIIMDFSVICLTKLSSSEGDIETIGCCYRACLALLRNTVHTFIIRNNCNLTRNEIMCEAPAPNDSHQNRTDECADLDERNMDTNNNFDEALAAIDLDRIVKRNKTAGAEGRIILDDLGGHEVWAFLLKSLEQAKPSLRFAIDRDQIRSEFTNIGKVVCNMHSTAICALLSSLAIALDTGQERLDVLLKSLSPMSASGCSSNSGDTMSNDNSFLNDIRYCLCAEICHISKIPQFRKNLREDIKETILCSFISATTNASVVNLFPTVDLDIMATVGGNSSREREKRLFRKLSKKFAAYQHTANNLPPHPDAEGLGLRKVRGDYYDTPGATYLSSHFWTFRKDLALVLNDDQNPQRCRVLSDVGISLLNNDGDLDDYVRNICSDVLESLSQITLEREILKRLIILRGILSACLRNTTLLLAHEKDVVSRITSTLISGMLREYSLLLKGADYWKDPQRSELYHRAKSHVLLSAYDIFVASTFSWLISQLAFTNFGLDKAQFLYRSIILPSLKNRGLNFSQTLLEAAKKSISFEYGVPDLTHPHTTSTLVAKPAFLAPVLRHYTRELVVYAASSPEDNLFYDLMNCIIGLDQDIIHHVNMIPAFIGEIDGKSFDKKTDLSASIELYLSLISMSESRNHTKRNASINRFRTYAIRTFLLPKLKHPTSPLDQKIKILNLLSSFLDVATIRHQYDCFDNMTVSLDDGEIKYLHLSHDLVEMARSIFECLDNAIEASKDGREASLVLLSQCYACLCSIISLEVEGEDCCVRKWCETFSRSNQDAYRMSLYVETMYRISRFFTNDQKSVLRFYGTVPPIGILSESLVNDLQQMNELKKRIEGFERKSASKIKNKYTNSYASHTRGINNPVNTTVNEEQAENSFGSLAAFQGLYKSLIDI